MKNIIYILLASVCVLIISLFFSIDGCNSNKTEIISDTVIVIDTFYVNIKQDTFYVQNPTKIKETIIKEIPKNYIPKKDYDDLKEQYVDLLVEFLKQLEYEDTFRADSFWVSVNSFLSQNKIDSQLAVFGGKIPVIKETSIITNKEIERRFKVFAGGGFSYEIKGSNKVGFNGKILFKNRKDNALLLGYGVNTLGEQNVETSLLIKLGFRK